MENQGEKDMKKILKLIMAAAMALSLGACGGKDDTPDKVTLKVWASQNDQAMTQEMVNAWVAKQEKDYPNTKWEVTLGVVGEPDAAKTLLDDPTAGADVFSFPNDQLRTLVAAGALAKVTRNADDIKSRNGAGAVESATFDGQLYAYPMTADNGYFLYYDSSVLTAEDVKTVEGLMTAADKAGKKVLMDLANGWYVASFFFATGGRLGLDADGNQTCNFNDANGLIAGEGLKVFTGSNAYLNGDDNVLKAGFQDGTIAAGVSGTWNAPDVQKYLGENYAAAKLPTFSVDGKEYQMSSFGGYKQLGVNSQSEFLVYAMDLADFLTNEENQLKRFNTMGYGPSNTKVAASDAVQANPALAALAAQSVYAVAQNDVLNPFWDAAKAFGQTMINKDYSTPMQDLLDAMVNQIVTPAE